MKRFVLALPLVLMLNMFTLVSQTIHQQEETLKLMLLVNNYFTTKYPDPCQQTFLW